MNGLYSPRCPSCGSYITKNLRVDDTFVEATHMQKQKDYFDFIEQSSNGRLVLLELGIYHKKFLITY